MTALAKKVRTAMFICGVALYALCLLLPLGYFLILELTNGFLVANIYLCIVLFICILLLGVFICLARIKRLLKLHMKHMKENDNEESKRIPWAKQPLWGKICSALVIVQMPFVVYACILGLWEGGWGWLRLGYSLTCLLIPLGIWLHKYK